MAGKRPQERCRWALDARERNRWIRRAEDELGGFFVAQPPATVRCGPRSILICEPCRRKNGWPER